ncbi:hypothetical protein K439DRAFT_1371440 [Ramaria rubella]|nr:hypothetical protein K439DRAFT_1371440 [Ramaria rubella]
MNNTRILQVAVKGESLLVNPRLNKGSAFSREERSKLDLTGRLPYRIDSLEQQCQRAYDQFASRGAPLLKNTFLQSLKAQNWILYYSLIKRHLKEMIPIIYTPTEAEAIASYSHLFRRSEGLYLSFPQADSMERDYLDATKGREIDLVVCSDAEAILGIGDQGVGISTAKSAIYTLLAGIDPSCALSVTLDVGTNNEDLLNDDLYIGWPNSRVRGEDYDQFVDKFVSLVRKYHPHSLLHFEDFGTSNAQRLLEIYRDKHAVFNDDIQGTGAVTLSAVIASLGVTQSTLSSQRIICFGAGSAGLGIARQIRDAMIQLDGMSHKDANARFWLIDRDGLLTRSMQDEGKLRHDVDEFVRQDWDGPGSLLDVVKKVKPTILIGCSTKAGAFNEDVVRSMKEGCERPVVLPLSNPSRLVEVTPEDCLKWTDGRALIATGSPFPSVKIHGKEIDIAECNNALIYPGLGFGTILSRSRSMTPGMILAGAQRLANLSPAHKDPTAALLPDFGDSPSVNLEVAIAVAEQAITEGSAGVKWGQEEVRERAKAARWEPLYQEYVYDERGEM